MVYLMGGSWWIVKAMFGGRLCYKRKTFQIRKASPKEKKCACHLARVLLHVCVCVCVCVCLCVLMYVYALVCTCACVHVHVVLRFISVYMYMYI